MSNEQSAVPQGLAAEAMGDLDARQAAGRSAAAAEFPELRAERRADTQGDIRLDAILDVPVMVSMEIGRSRISIRNLLQLNQGSVVELDRLAGEAMDVLVNGTLVAQGEVVVVNDKFGIRLTDIISPSERVKRLRG
jgi:flagellar motor switch protein FliN